VETTGVSGVVGRGTDIHGVSHPVVTWKNESTNAAGVLKLGIWRTRKSPPAVSYE
jgi:hypothetical protein